MFSLSLIPPDAILAQAVKLEHRVADLRICSKFLQLYIQEIRD